MQEQPGLVDATHASMRTPVRSTLVWIAARSLFAVAAAQQQAAGSTAGSGGHTAERSSSSMNGDVWPFAISVRVRQGHPGPTVARTTVGRHPRQEVQNLITLDDGGDPNPVLGANRASSLLTPRSRPVPFSASPSSVDCARRRAHPWSGRSPGRMLPRPPAGPEQVSAPSPARGLSAQAQPAITWVGPLVDVIKANREDGATRRSPHLLQLCVPHRFADAFGRR